MYGPKASFPLFHFSLLFPHFQVSTYAANWHVSNLLPAELICQFFQARSIDLSMAHSTYHILRVDRAQTGDVQLQGDVGCYSYARTEKGK